MTSIFGGNFLQNFFLYLLNERYSRLNILIFFPKIGQKILITHKEILIKINTYFLRVCRRNPAWDLGRVGHKGDMFHWSQMVMLSRYCDCKLLWDPTDRWKLCWVRRLTSSLHPVSRQPGYLQYITPAVACSTAVTGVTMAQAVSRCPSLETVQESGTRDQGASTRCDWGKIIYWWSPVLHFQR